MTLRAPNFCDACKRRVSTPDGPTCAAFPDGIPEPILNGFDHRRPFPGDGGVRFVRDPDKPLPEGAGEAEPPDEPVFITRPDKPLRHHTDRERRELAKRMIEAFKAHPDRS